LNLHPHHLHLHADRFLRYLNTNPQYRDVAMLRAMLLLSRDEWLQFHQDHMLSLAESPEMSPTLMMQPSDLGAMHGGEKALPAFPRMLQDAVAGRLNDAHPHLTPEHREAKLTVFEGQARWFDALMEHSKTLGTLLRFLGSKRTDLGMAWRTLKLHLTRVHGCVLPVGLCTPTNGPITALHIHAHLTALTTAFQDLGTHEAWVAGDHFLESVFFHHGAVRALGKYVEALQLLGQFEGKAAKAAHALKRVESVTSLIVTEANVRRVEETTLELQVVRKEVHKAGRRLLKVEAALEVEVGHARDRLRIEAAHVLGEYARVEMEQEECILHSLEAMLERL
jgi:hypothetical protein